jgi:hypothetical protein
MNGKIRNKKRATIKVAVSVTFTYTEGCLQTVLDILPTFDRGLVDAGRRLAKKHSTPDCHIVVSRC